MSAKAELLMEIDKTSDYVKRTNSQIAQNALKDALKALDSGDESWMKHAAATLRQVHD